MWHEFRNDTDSVPLSLTSSVHTRLIRRQLLECLVLIGHGYQEIHIHGIEQVSILMFNQCSQLDQRCPFNNVAGPHLVLTICDRGA